MNKDWEKKIIALAKKIKGLSARDKDSIIEFAIHREWGLALDTLCFQLYEYEVPITPEEFKEIKSLSEAIKINKKILILLKQLIKKEA